MTAHEALINATERNISEPKKRGQVKHSTHRLLVPPTGLLPHPDGDVGLAPRADGQAPVGPRHTSRLSRVRPSFLTQRAQHRGVVRREVRLSGPEGRAGHVGKGKQCRRSTLRLIGWLVWLVRVALRGVGSGREG